MRASGITHAGATDIPSLDRLLKAGEFAHLLAQFSHTQVTAALRTVLGALREHAPSGTLEFVALRPDSIAMQVEGLLQSETRPRLRPVFNLTGTVLHTNLGRAVLPESVAQSVVTALTAPNNLEYDLENGGRGDRDHVLDPLLCRLTGAEAATVVNNNAAAVLLVLNTLAKNREVIVSRGELVEIGGAFRIPDVMRSAGTKLIEVGTTNRTHRSDYEAAINPRTAVLMKVHTSNYVISGYTAAVSLGQLAELAHEQSLPAVVDLGSGSLVDLARWGLPREPVVRDAIEAGADLVMFSGDKLLGGPQAGIIVGRKELIRRVNRNPLKRALRVGKLTLAALEGVLALYCAPERLAERLTTLRLLTRALPEIEAQARRLLSVVQNALGGRFDVTAASMKSQIGSGSLPIEQLESFGLRVQKAGAGGAGLNRLEALLRTVPRPILGRIADKALWLDLRCLEIADEAEFCGQWGMLGR